VDQARSARRGEDVDAARVIVWGTSFGGGHAIVTAADDGEVVAAISQCPFTDGIASALATDPRTSVKVGALALRDAVGSLAGRPPVMVALAGPGDEQLAALIDGVACGVGDYSPFRGAPWFPRIDGRR